MLLITRMYPSSPDLFHMCLINKVSAEPLTVYPAGSVAVELDSIPAVRHHEYHMIPPHIQLKLK